MSIIIDGYWNLPDKHRASPLVTCFLALKYILHIPHLLTKQKVGKFLKIVSLVLFDGIRAEGFLSVN